MDELAMFVTRGGVLFFSSLSLSFETVTQIASQTAASRDVRVVRECESERV